MRDILTRLLENVRSHGAVFDRSALGAPWSMRIEERAPLTLLALLDGTAWISPEGGEATALASGEVALVVGPEPYTIADRPHAAVQVVVGPGNACTTPGGAPMHAPAAGVCRLGDGPEPAAQLLKGTYEVHRGVCEQVVGGLPRVVVVPADGALDPVLALVVTELTAARPGGQAVLDRLLDLLLVSTLRDWLDRPGSGAPGWYAALADPVVGPALRRMHDEPEQPWTVAGLAAEAGVSRSVFARRFTETVGEPPMAHLACWRVCLAADLLRETDATVAAIAQQVGYANAFALSVAVKRALGLRPSDLRAKAREAVGF